MTRAALIAVCLSAAACGVDQSARARSTTPRQIQANGQPTTLMVDAIGVSGSPGEGSVTLKLSAGVLKETTLALAAGSATTVYSCLSNCGSSATITATWHSSLHDLTDPQLVSAPGFGVVIRQ